MFLAFKVLRVVMRVKLFLEGMTTLATFRNYSGGRMRFVMLMLGRTAVLCKLITLTY